MIDNLVSNIANLLSGSEHFKLSKKYNLESIVNSYRQFILDISVNQDSNPISYKRMGRMFQISTNLTTYQLPFKIFHTSDGHFVLVSKNKESIIAYRQSDNKKGQTPIHIGIDLSTHQKMIIKSCLNESESEIYQEILDSQPQGVTKASDLTSYIKKYKKKSKSAKRKEKIIEPYYQNSIPLSQINSNMKNIVISLVKGLLFFKKIGYIHNDIKPDNILFSTSSENNSIESLLIDFNLAEKKETQSLKSLSGTPGHIPPESILGKDHSNKDSFALAVSLIYLIIKSNNIPSLIIYGAPTIANQIWESTINLSYDQFLAKKQELQNEVDEFFKLLLKRIDPKNEETLQLIELIQPLMAIDPSNRPSLHDFQASLLKLTPQ